MKQTQIYRAAVAYGAYKVASWAWNKWSGSSNQEEDIVNNEASSSRNLNHSSRRMKQKSRRNFMRKRKRSIHQCYFETMRASQEFMGSLRQTIESHTDYSNETKRLKQIRKKSIENGVVDQEDLWRVIKIKSMTRMVATLYVNTMLYLLLTVQIHVLGGCMFRDNQRSQSNEHDTFASGVNDQNNRKITELNQSKTITKDTHAAVLMQTHNFFSEVGIVELLNKIQSVVEKSTEKWITIKQSNNQLGVISSNDMTSTIKAIRCIETDGIIFDFFTISQQENGSQNQLENNLIDETFDISESPLFEESLSDCLQSSFQLLDSQLRSHLFQDQDTIHLVHVFGKLKKITNMFYETPQSRDDGQVWWDDEQVSFPNMYIQDMDRLETLKELGDVSFN